MLAVGLAAGSIPTAAVASAGFCAEGTAHDYAKPLKQLAGMRPGPAREHLPFAPARIFFNHSWGGPLFVGGGEVGYSLSYLPYFPGHHLSPPLNWTVEGRYVRVDKRGKTTRVRGHIVRRINRLRAEEDKPSGRVAFLFKAGKPALYRLEITFTDPSGKRLARYGEYLRVLKPKLDARLALNGTTFKPGEHVTARLDNYGTTTLSFGLDRSIEYFDGTSWITAPNSAQGAVLAIGLGLGPGASAECWGFTIPPNEPPGQYRFVVRADSSRGLRQGGGEDLTLRSEFQVVPPS
ncbi:MAG TPA: immunoglobulin-like domain-containing protein [Solirubrobacterales bacterium]